MKLLLRSTLLILAALLALLPLAAPHPVTAQTHHDYDQLLEPGHYIGFISLILHSDAIVPMQGSGGTSKVEYEGLWIQKTGLMEMVIEEDQSAWVEINLNPVNVYMDYFAYIKTPVGDCNWGASWRGEMRHDPETFGYRTYDSFWVTMPYSGVRTSSFDMYEATGSLQGCDMRPSNSIWKSLLIHADFQSKGIIQMILLVDNRPNPGHFNGSCIVDGWDISGDTLTRNTRECKWNAWKSDWPLLLQAKKHGRK